MDLFGGTLGHFHLRGMSGTPKDVENVEILAAYVEAVSNAFILMVQKLGLIGLVEKNAALVTWYNAEISAS
jgi:hypothetical protein